MAGALLRCTTPPRVITVIDANNVRGHTTHCRLDRFCAAVWHWWRESDDGAVLLCIDHGMREASECVANGFAVTFSGSNCDADTDIVLAVDELLKQHPKALLRVVTNDRQLKCRCRRVLPNLHADADDDWYLRHGIHKPSARYAREWARGASRETAQLDRISLVPSESFAAELERTAAPSVRELTVETIPPTHLLSWLVLWSSMMTLWVAGPLHKAWCWFVRLLGVAAAASDIDSEGAAFSSSPFAMGAAAVERRAANERNGRRRKRRKPAQEAEWRQLEASELTIRPTVRC